MNKKKHVITLSTIARNDFQEITSMIQDIVTKMGIREGGVIIFVPHTTAGITINENADRDVITDMYKALDLIIPWTNNYKHYEGNTAAHVKASLMGSSVTVFVEEGKLVLGTWQGIFFAEFDGPRTRTVYVKGF